MHATATPVPFFRPAASDYCQQAADATSKKADYNNLYLSIQHTSFVDVPNADQL